MQNLYQNKLDLLNKYNLRESSNLNTIYNSLTISIVDNKKNVIKENNLDKIFLTSFFLYIFNSNPKFEFKLEKEKNFETEALIPYIYVKNKAKIMKISTILILENKNKIKIFYDNSSITILIPLNQLIQQYELNEYLLDHKFDGLYLKAKIKHLTDLNINVKNLYPFWISQNN
jgi:hypothetical protein